jgi:chromosome segregation ATPase
MNRHLQTAFNKLQRKQVELNKTQLSVVDDIDNEFDWLEQSYSEASYLAYDAGDEWLDRIAEFRSEVMIFWDNAVVNGAATSLEEAAERMAEKIQKLEQSADELGVDPADLVRNYEEIKEILANWQSTYEDARRAYQDVREKMEQGIADFW